MHDGICQKRKTDRAGSQDRAHINGKKLPQPPEKSPIAKPLRVSESGPSSLVGGSSGKGVEAVGMASFIVSTAAVLPFTGCRNRKLAGDYMGLENFSMRQNIKALPRSLKRFFPERYRSGHNGADSKSDGGQPPTRFRIPPSPPIQVVQCSQAPAGGSGCANGSRLNRDRTRATWCRTQGSMAMSAKGHYRNLQCSSHHRFQQKPAPARFSREK